MGADLGAGATALGLVELLFLAGSVAFLLPVGRLADASDKNTLYKAGLAAFVVTCLLIGSLSSMPAILCIRFLMGVCSAIFAATGPAILADIVPPDQRGKAYGASIGAIYAGLCLGPILGGVLIDLWGWRAVFFAGAAIIAIGLVVVQALLRSKWRKPTDSVPLFSTFLVAAAILLLVAGSATLRNGPIGYVYLASGIAVGALFVIVQRRSDRPLLDVGALMANRPLRSALLIQLLLYVNAFASIFMLSIYMQVSLGHSAKTSGQVLAIGSVLMAIVAPMAGRLADRFRPAVISTIGVTGVTASSALATTLGHDTALTFITGMLALQGLGFAFFSSPNMTIIMSSVPPSATSTASALGAKARSLGMVTGMLITGILISLSIGNDPVEQHPLEFIDTMRTTYSILVGLTILALVVSAARLLRRPSP
jgi:MFS family permease